MTYPPPPPEHQQSAAQQYGHPGYQASYPGYSAYGPGEPTLRSNPIAGILLLLGSLAGLAAALIPNGRNQLPVVAAFDTFEQAELLGGEAWRAYALGAGPLVLALGSLLALVAGVRMFSAGRHGGAATLGVVGALLMLACPIVMLIGSDGTILNDDMTVGLALALSAWLPALIGALVGYRK